MDDGMAVWAYWPQVLDRMQLVLRPYLCDWDDMVYVNVSGRCFAIVGLEVEPTSSTTPAVVPEACLSRSLVPLVCVHENVTSSPLHVLDIGGQLFRCKVLRPRVSLLPGRRFERSK